MLRRITNSPPSIQDVTDNSLKGKTDLRNGDIIKATVIGRLKGDNYLVFARGRKIQVFSPLPLADGGKYLFKAIAGDKGIELRVMSEFPEAVRVNRKVTTTGRMTGFGLTKILSHLTKIIDSDLKGLLLSIKNSIAVKDTEGGDLQAIAMKIKEALDLIEREQLLNLASLREGYGWLMHLAGLEEDGFESIDLFVEKKSERKGLFFSVFMELTRLGKMELNVSIIDKRTDIRIFAENDKMSEYINDHLPELEERLKKSGLINGKLVCGVKDFKDGFEIKEMGDGSSVHVII